MGIPHAPMHTNVEYTMHPHYMEDKMKRCDSQQNTSFLSEKSSGYDFENLVQDESKRTPVHEDILSKGFKKNIEQADEKQPIKTKTRDHKSLHSRAQTVQLKKFKTKSRSITPSWQKSNVEERKFGNDLKKYNDNGEKRDIDARYEPVPNSHFSKHGLKDRADYLTLDDGDGKTTFYHYKEVERQQKRSTEDDRAPRKKKISTKGVNKTDQPMINSTAEEIHGKLGQQTLIVDNKEEILREALKKRLANKIPNEENLIRNEKETPNKKENISDNSKEIKQNEEKISLLDKVNRIIKSCVMLKEERKTNENITNNETKKIEHNEENKVLMVADLESGYHEAIINPSETLSKVKDYKLEEGELKDSDQDDESELIGLETIQRTVTIIKIRGELLGLILVLHLELGLGPHIHHSEWPVLHVSLDGGVFELTTNETLGVKDGVGGVDGHLVLGGVTNQPLGVGECNVGGGGAVTLVIRDDFNLSMLEHSHAGVGGSKVNTHCCLLTSHSFLVSLLSFLSE